MGYQVIHCLKKKKKKKETRKTKTTYNQDKNYPVENFNKLLRVQWDRRKERFYYRFTRNSPQIR